MVPFNTKELVCVYSQASLDKINEKFLKEAILKLGEDLESSSQAFALAGETILNGEEIIDVEYPHGTEFKGVTILYGYKYEDVTYIADCKSLNPNAVGIADKNLWMYSEVPIESLSHRNKRIEITCDSSSEKTNNFINIYLGEALVVESEDEIEKIDESQIKQWIEAINIEAENQAKPAPMWNFIT